MAIVSGMHSACSNYVIPGFYCICPYSAIKADIRTKVYITTVIRVQVADTAMRG